MVLLVECLRPPACVVLSENAEIIVFEKGPYVSFANCGLPYYVGGEIEERENLIVQSSKALQKPF